MCQLNRHPGILDQRAGRNAQVVVNYPIGGTGDINRAQFLKVMHAQSRSCLTVVWLDSHTLLCVVKFSLVSLGVTVV